MIDLAMWGREVEYPFHLGAQHWFWSRMHSDGVRRGNLSCMVWRNFICRYPISDQVIWKFGCGTKAKERETKLTADIALSLIYLLRICYTALHVNPSHQGFVLYKANYMT